MKTSRIIMAAGIVLLVLAGFYILRNGPAAPAADGAAPPAAVKVQPAKKPVL